MEINKDWLTEKYNRIEELATDFSISKYNLLKISFIKRLLEESLKRKNSCKTCESNLARLEILIEEIPLLDQIDHRQPYEKEFNSIRNHFHKKHGFITPYHHATRWTLVGIFVGLITSIIASLLFKNKILIDPVLAGSALGLIIGYLIGATKEASFRKSKMII